MAKKIFNKRTLAMVLALVMCFSLVSITALADSRRPGNSNNKPGSGTSSSSEYEWYKVYINGNLEDEAQGTAGDHTWLVQGVYSWDVSISGTTLKWRAGAHSGEVDLNKYIVIPDGYEVREDGCTIDHSDVSGDNSQSDQFDNAVITVTINVLFDQTTGETIPVETVPEITEPEITEPEITEPEITEPEVTEPEITEPEITEPEITEPEITEPEITEPEITEPEITEPEITEPEITEPEITEPEITEPEITEPEITEPEITEPEITEPEITEPEITEPEITEPEKYEVIHEYYTDNEHDGTVPGGEIDPNNEIEKKPQYNGEDYVYVRTELDADNNTITVIYHREILVDIPDEDVPLVEIPDEDVPLVEIPDEEVPLADVPKTGDPMTVYAALAALSAMGLAALGFKKKED